MQKMKLHPGARKLYVQATLERLLEIMKSGTYKNYVWFFTKMACHFKRKFIPKSMKSKFSFMFKQHFTFDKTFKWTESRDLLVRFLSFTSKNKKTKRKQRCQVTHCRVMKALRSRIRVFGHSVFPLNHRPTLFKLYLSIYLYFYIYIK